MTWFDETEEYPYVGFILNLLIIYFVVTQITSIYLQCNVYVWWCFKILQVQKLIKVIMCIELYDRNLVLQP